MELRRDGGLVLQGKGVSGGLGRQRVLARRARERGQRRRGASDGAGPVRHAIGAGVTPETAGFIGASTCATLRRGAIVVDTAHRPVVDRAALTGALARGHRGGADAGELRAGAGGTAPPDDRLLRLPDVTLTPPVAGASPNTVTLAAAISPASRCKNPCWGRHEERRA